MKSFISANSTISSNRLATSRFDSPSMMPLMKTFSRPEISGWNPAPSSINAEIRPLTRTLPDVGLVMPATSFSIVLLPDPLRPITPSVRPAGTVERHVADGAERLVRVQIANQAAAKQRALQRRELPLVAEAAIDLRGVDDFDCVHWSRALSIPNFQLPTPKTSLLRRDRVWELEVGSWELSTTWLQTSSAKVSRNRSNTQ